MWQRSDVHGCTCGIRGCISHFLCKKCVKIAQKHFLVLFLEFAETPLFVQLHVFAVWALRLERNTQPQLKDRKNSLKKKFLGSMFPGIRDPHHILEPDPWMSWTEFHRKVPFLLSPTMNSCAREPPQFSKKRSENEGANENLSGGFAAIPGIAPRVTPRIVGFALIKS